MKNNLERRKQAIQRRITKTEKRLQKLSVLRLISFFSLPLGIVLLYGLQFDLFLSIGILIPFVAFFYFIVIRYNHIHDFKVRLISNETFISREILRKEKKTKSLFRSIPVEESIRENHPYCEDLNIFEKDGLFSLIDTSSTETGERIFLKNLLQLNDESDETINERQLRVRQLSANPWFSYKFIRIASENWEFFLGKKWKTDGWKNKAINFFEKRKILHTIFPIYSIISCLLILSALLFQSPFGAPLFLLNIILFITYRGDTIKELKKIEETIKRKTETHRLILFINSKKGKVTRDEINKVFKKFTKAYSSLYMAPLPHFLANALYLHDLWTMKRLINWKSKFGKRTQDWIEDLEEIDSLIPLVHLKFCNPHWVFPKISTDISGITGENLAHPLLLDKQAIPNPLYKLEKGKVLLITGSNMAGKTTYMRTVGTNILLGLCGGPCHATSLEFPPLSISCSVKNQDSLTEGISLFYAEARRLAKIFHDISENKKTYLILLDEILKGTNTKERYLASEKILTQLQGKNTFTLCTTHDLDLAKIPNIELKHFTEKIEDNNMSFDYKIREGVVQTTNALFILKKEGVIP